MNNSDKRKLFNKVLEQKSQSLLQGYRRRQRGGMSFKLLEGLLALCGRSNKDIEERIKEFSKMFAEECFDEFLQLEECQECQEVPTRTKEEWLIMGFSSTDNYFANDEYIIVDEKTIRSAVLFWIGNEISFSRLKAFTDINQIDVNTNDLRGAFTLYALRIHSHGELYRGAKEEDRYMISTKVIASCRNDNVDLRAEHLGHISPQVAQTCEFFSLV